jgi:hypothetical protein
LVACGLWLSCRRLPIRRALATLELHQHRAQRGYASGRKPFTWDRASAMEANHIPQHALADLGELLLIWHWVRIDENRYIGHYVHEPI